MTIIALFLYSTILTILALRKKHNLLIYFLFASFFKLTNQKTIAPK